jgi:hypothetical protein
MIGYPPLLVGADQNRVACVGDDAYPERFVGGFGSEPVDDDVGVTDISDDAVLVPTEFIAETL